MAYCYTVIHIGPAYAPPPPDGFWLLLFLCMPHYNTIAGTAHKHKLVLILIPTRKVLCSTFYLLAARARARGASLRAGCLLYKAMSLTGQTTA
jgi:O-antigen ligase